MSMCLAAILLAKITTLGEILVGTGLVGGILLAALLARTLNKRKETREDGGGQTRPNSSSTRREIPVG
jgi:hypothetical protein